MPNQDISVGHVTRRGLIVDGAATLIALPTISLASSAGTRIAIIVDEAGPIISPDNFGYLLEQLGSSISGGVWVGQNSKIPNVAGIRRDIVEHLRAIKTSVIRWPGGISGDSYDWRDGIGPSERRPRRTNFYADTFPANIGNVPEKFESNQFGTDEFMRLCRITSARPFISANIRALTPAVFDQWVDYCNSPVGTTSLADERSRNGSPEPYAVSYWGIGNEVWGGGGSLTVDEYLQIYKRFATAIPDREIKPQLIACGAQPGESLEWVSRLMSGIISNYAPVPISAVSIHRYAGLGLNKIRAGETYLSARRRTSLDNPPAISSSTADWYSMLAHYNELDDYIRRHWEIMGEFDPKHTVKLAVDEWGAICKPGTEISPENIGSRAVTLRDVLGAAITLDILNRHCGKLLLACFTGMINQEGGLFLSEGERFLPTGIYHVFRMYSPHQGGRLIRTMFDSPDISAQDGSARRSFPGLSGSASLKDRVLTLTVVNAHASAPITATIELRGAKAASSTLEVLSSDDINAQNTFANPSALFPVSQAIDGRGMEFTHSFAPASVSRISLELR